MIERKLRLRKERELQSVHRDSHRGLTPKWLWKQIAKAAYAGQGWFVIGLAGRASAVFSIHITQGPLQAFALASMLLLYRSSLHGCPISRWATVVTRGG
jgi:hypothetical protein